MPAAPHPDPPSAGPALGADAMADVLADLLPLRLPLAPRAAWMARVRVAA
ncbi:MAG: hypothetical protein ACNA8N_04615 [Trueperaceae bacterium]